MLLIDAKDIKKSFGERVLFEIPSLKIYSNDKVGIVGKNGSGKTTLLHLLQNRDMNHEGHIQIMGSFSYITQLDTPTDEYLNAEEMSKYGLTHRKRETMSGGELTKLKIAQALSSNQHILFADEPTCNLDIKAIHELENLLIDYVGAVVLVSHDKELLNRVCNKILEIEDQKVTVYKGNYTDYMHLKEEREQRKHVEYEQYRKERRRLEKAMMQKSSQAKAMKKTPSRMGNSEARLHKRSVGVKKAKLEKNALAIKKRIEQMEIKEKPKIQKATKITLPEYLRVYSKTVVELENLHKSFGSRHLFSCKTIRIKNNKKTALLGDNGTGKTTLLDMIIKGSEGIRLAPKAVFGYFKQNLKNLEEDKSILENVMSTTTMKEEIVRTVLGRLLFRKQDVFKKIEQLSGGERVKASFAKVFLSDINVLLMDEPTNYLDIESRAALMQVLKDYEGAVIFVTHDREFIHYLADEIIEIKDGQLTYYPYPYSYVLEKVDTHKNKKCHQNKQLLEEKIQLENRLNYLVGRLSIPDGKRDMKVLDKEYQEVLIRLKELRKLL